MLTALHITLPKGNHQRVTGQQQQQEQQQLSNRCLVVNDTTGEAILTSTDASLKYTNSTSNEMRDAGTRFRFDHVTISPHHGSLFVKQVAPMLYDLCRSFTLHTTRNTTTGNNSYSSHSSSIPTPTPLLSSSSSSLSRSVFIHGSSTSTDRRGLFHHIAKATAHTLRRQAGISSSSSSSLPISSTLSSSSPSFSSLSFALVDLYHVWGTGDVLDPDAALHDRARLERLRREQPRRTVNKPKGMAFVEPTQYTLNGQERIDTCIARALQRVEPPRALSTDAEREDHAVKSTLILTFTIAHYSSSGEGEKHEAMIQPLGDERYNMQEAKRHNNKNKKKKIVPTVEARFHIILLPDSTAALHGKHGAQELSALATALGACVQWRSEGSNFNVDPQSQLKQMETSIPSSNLPWAPLRESPLLLYLFESTMYYSYQSERRLRQLRFATERRRLYGDDSRPISANTSAYSHNGRRSLSTSTATSVEHSYWNGTDISSGNVLDSISVGIGESLLILCVNSAWDQYYQARSSFLFVQRATNQPGALTPVSGEKIKEGHTISSVGHNVNNQTSKTPSTTWIHSPYAQEKKEPEKEIQGEVSPTLHEDMHIIEKEEFWSSPRRREKTEPRNQQEEDDDDGGYEEEEEEKEQNPFIQRMPSDVPVNEEDDDNNNNDYDYHNHNHDDAAKNNNGKGLKSGGLVLDVNMINSDTKPPRKLFSISSPCKTEASILRRHEVPTSNLVNMQSILTPPSSSHENMNRLHTHHNFLFDCKRQSVCSNTDVISSQEHPYAPKSSPVLGSPNRMHVQTTIPVLESMPTRGINMVSEHQKSHDTIHVIQSTPKTTPVSTSSASPSLCNKMISTSTQEFCNDALIAALQKQTALLSENERLRAVVAHLSSQQAENITDKHQIIGIADMHNAAVVRRREADRNAEIRALRDELAAASRKAGILKKTLTRSVDANRKMRRVIHRQLQQCLAELPRVFHDTVAEKKVAATCVDAEERISRVEKLLDTIATRVMHSVRDEVDNVKGREEYDDEEEEEEEEEEDEDKYNRKKKEYREKKTCSGNCGKVSPCRLSEKQSQYPLRENTKKYMVEEDYLINSSITHELQHVNHSTTKRKNVKKAVLNDDIESQVVQLLRIAYKLFIRESDNGNDGIFYNEIYESLSQEKKDNLRRKGFSLSQSVLNILSPDRKEENQLLNHHQKHHHHYHHKKKKKTQSDGNTDEFFSNKKVTENELCWKCHLNRYNQHSSAYPKFIELVRSLYNHITVDGYLFSRPQLKWNENEYIKENNQEGIMHEYTSARVKPDTHFSGGKVNVSLPHSGDTVLMQTRQLSNLLQQRSDTREAEHKALQEAKNELSREREWRRQLQDELLQLRVQVSKYEAKLDLIDETVKPRLSSGIVELEQMIAERKQKQDIERQQRAAVLSQIQKRLEQSVENVDLRPFPRSFS